MICIYTEIFYISYYIYIYINNIYLYRRFSCKGAFWGLPGAFAVPSPLQSAGAARALKMAVRPCPGAASALKKAARAA